jgi:hypothetical protein
MIFQNGASRGAVALETSTRNAPVSGVKPGIIAASGAVVLGFYRDLTRAGDKSRQHLEKM